MFRTALASLRAHKRRLLGTCSAVLLGVAFLAGTLVLGDTMRAGFGDLIDEANAGTDAFVRSSSEFDSDGIRQAGLLDASLVDEVAAVDGVRLAAPVVERSAQVVGSDGDPIGGNGPPTVASNWIEDEDLNPYHVVEGRAPQADHEVVIDKATADNGDLAIGDTTAVRVPEPIEVTVVGIARAGTSESLGGVTMAAFTLEAAQDLLLPDSDSLTGILVAADEGVSEAALVDDIAPMLPDDVEAITGADLTQEQKDDIEGDFLGFFETFLLVFAGIALVVAAFSIYNTFNIVVAQRTRESALLRALGASRRQILASVVVEAFAVGVLASALGIVAGLGLAKGLSAMMAGIGLELPSTATVLKPSTIVAGMVVGVVVTLLSSLAPALKASRVPPLAALRDVAIDRSGMSLWRGLVGGVVVAAGAAMTVAGATSAGSLPLTGFGALAMVVGLALLGPVVARPASRVLGSPWARLRGMSGRLARGNAMRNPRRTANTASALMVGVAVVTMFTVLAATLKAYIDQVTKDAFTADFVIASDSFSTVGLSPEMAQEIDELPEVETAASFGNAMFLVDGEEEFASAVDGDEFTKVIDLDVTQGAIEDLEAGTVALSETYAEDNRWSLGSLVPVSYVDGTSEELTVGALYDVSDLMGNIIVANETWAPHAVQPDDGAVLVNLAPGVGEGEGEAAIQAVADRYFAPDVQTREEYVESVAAQVDQMLAIIYVLLILAIVIATMGIANTLSLSIHERTRELGLLRAVGQSRRQLRSMVRGESIIVAIFGAVGGMGLGIFLGWALTKGLGQAEDAAEITDNFAVPPDQLVILLVAAAIVGLVAAMRPARRAARLDVLAAIATD